MAGQDEARAKAEACTYRAGHAQCVPRVRIALHEQVLRQHVRDKVCGSFQLSEARGDTDRRSSEGKAAPRGVGGCRFSKDSRPTTPEPTIFPDQENAERSAFAVECGTKDPREGGNLPGA